ncbi:DUF1206 domain-containing protein [Lutibaculum baratangense]|uniref:DUF1206 domain-containing protein n=1 Tax=Lutibaculum baratangense AMV1 TaxID=631454 RepID=V4RD40_9HYPH|nr:DUF1206 domain-containing protein [Lutibaculum baratangense]ESR24066.1 hypothetical protein N177_2515 [Lutibaculum baratangense AMV1]
MDVSRSLNWSARGGYAARGVVYLVVGTMAVLAAIGSGAAEDTQGALREILNQPLGGVLLGIVALGLVFFAIWRLIQAFGDPDGLGTGGKGLVIRAGMLGSAIIHLALAVFAASLIFSVSIGGGSGGGGGDPTAGWLSWLFGRDWGRWVALGIALVPVGIGIAHIVKGWKASYERYMMADAETLRRIRPVCAFGLIARGVTFIVIGILAFYGGGIYDANDAPGLDEALQWIQDLPFGWLLLLMVALGLIAFAAYAFVEAWYRRIGVERAGV